MTTKDDNPSTSSFAKKEDNTGPVKLLKVISREDVKDIESSTKKDNSKELLVKEIEINAVDVPVSIVVNWILNGTGYVPIWEFKDINKPINLVGTFSIERALESISAYLDIEYSVNTQKKAVNFRSTIRKTYKIPYQSIEQSFEVNISTSMSYGSSAGSGSSSSGSGSSSTGSSSKTSTKKAGENFWNQVDANIKSIVGTDGKTVIDKTLGLIVVEAPQSKIRLIDEYIVASVKKELGRMVEVEISIIEVSFNKKRTIGVDWSLVDKNVGNILLSTRNVLAANTIPSGTFPISFTVSSTSNPHNAIINALTTQGDVNILSKPKLLISNNSTSVIEVGDSYGYLEKVETTATQTTSSTALTPGVVKDGLVVHITPRILEDDRIFIGLSPFLTDLKNIRSVSSGGNSIEIPEKSDRNLFANILVNNGETVVLGGLISEENKYQISGLPGLNSIPVLGALFGTSEKTGSKKELIIAVTAKIVNL